MQVGKKTVLSIFWECTRGYRTVAGLSLFCSTTGSSIELITPLYYKIFFDGLTRGVDQFGSQAAWPILMILFLNGFAWLINLFGTLLTNYAQPKSMVALEQSSFAYVIRHSYKFFTDMFTGSLTRRIGRLSRSFEAFYDILKDQFLPLVIAVVGALIVLTIKFPIIALVVLIWMILLVTANLVFAKWKMPYDLKRTEKDSETSGVLSDALTNSLNIKLFTGYAHERLRFSKVTNELARLRTFGWNLDIISNGSQWAFMILIEFATTFFAISLWRKHQLSLGDFAMIQGYVMALMGKFSSFRYMIRRLYEAFAEGREMVDILNQPHGIQDLARAKPLVVSQGEIEFRDVRFSYEKTGRILNDFSLIIKPKEKVGLVGPSGAGKSTVLKLLLGFFDIQRGQILIDGQQIQRVTQDSLRDYIGIVPQEPILFHRTLMDNIRYGRREASDEDVIEASKKARCHEFITHLPQGYDTYVGERGIKLSGGERQRVAIARAILKNAPILLLDEATSSLDSESEALIQEALIELMKDKTAIAIAHRLSTIMQMDRIVVMENGHVVDTGTHPQLLRHKGLYHNLWKIQAGGFLP